MKKPRSEMLSQLLEDGELTSAFRRRRDVHDYKKIPTADRQKYDTDAWQLHKQMTSYLWIKRPKSPELILEDRVWCLFYRMGYRRISGMDFQIKFKDNTGDIGAKHINV
ncbi:MAG: hypothetical protein WAV27_22715, partial [Xanthobacteraceae bacterium]